MIELPTLVETSTTSDEPPVHYLKKRDSDDDDDDDYGNDNDDDNPSAGDTPRCSMERRTCGSSSAPPEPARLAVVEMVDDEEDISASNHDSVDIIDTEKKDEDEVINTEAQNIDHRQQPQPADDGKTTGSDDNIIRAENPEAQKNIDHHHHQPQAEDNEKTSDSDDNIISGVKEQDGSKAVNTKLDHQQRAELQTVAADSTSDSIDSITSTDKETDVAVVITTEAQNIYLQQKQQLLQSADGDELATNKDPKIDEIIMAEPADESDEVKTGPDLSSSSTEPVEAAKGGEKEEREDSMTDPESTVAPLSTAELPQQEQLPPTIQQDSTSITNNETQENPCSYELQQQQEPPQLSSAAVSSCSADSCTKIPSPSKQSDGTGDNSGIQDGPNEEGVKITSANQETPQDEEPEALSGAPNRDTPYMGGEDDGVLNDAAAVDNPSVNIPFAELKGTQPAVIPTCELDSPSSDTAVAPPPAEHPLALAEATEMERSGGVCLSVTDKELFEEREGKEKEEAFPSVTATMNNNNPPSSAPSTGSEEGKHRGDGVGEQDVGPGLNDNEEVGKRTEKEPSLSNEDPEHVQVLKEKFVSVVSELKKRIEKEEEAVSRTELGLEVKEENLKVADSEVSKLHPEHSVNQKIYAVPVGTNADNTTSAMAVSSNHAPHTMSIGTEPPTKPPLVRVADGEEKSRQSNQSPHPTKERESSTEPDKNASTYERPQDDKSAVAASDDSETPLATSSQKDESLIEGGKKVAPVHPHPERVTEQADKLAEASNIEDADTPTTENILPPATNIDTKHVDSKVVKARDLSPPPLPILPSSNHSLSVSKDKKRQQVLQDEDLTFASTNTSTSDSTPTGTPQPPSSPVLKPVESACCNTVKKGTASYDQDGSISRYTLANASPISSMSLEGNQGFVTPAPLGRPVVTSGNTSLAVALQMPSMITAPARRSSLEDSNHSPRARRNSSGRPKRLADLIRLDLWSQDVGTVEAALMRLHEAALNKSVRIYFVYFFKNF